MGTRCLRARCLRIDTNRSNGTSYILTINDPTREERRWKKLEPLSSRLQQRCQELCQELLCGKILYARGGMLLMSLGFVGN